MSADNYLVSIPARNGRIGLYEVSHSDSRINVDDPDHVLCQAIVAHALSCVGTYDNEHDLVAAVKNEYAARVIEYPAVYRHTSPIRSRPHKP